MIQYVDSVDGIRAENLQGFFEGWANPPSPETHLKLLRNSDEIVFAVDEETGSVVGFVTAISDGVLSAYIPLAEVLAEYQGKGIGSELVRRVLAKLEGLYMADVCCDKELQPFYAQFGMKPGWSMVLRRYDRQSGA